MKKIIIGVSAALTVFALAGCNSQPSPAPTVTITEDAPSTDDGVVNSSQQFIDFVRANGGTYASVATDLDIINLGSTICQGFADGLSEEEITYVLAQALINNDMDNDEGARLGAALIVGAKNYLCSGSVF